MAACLPPKAAASFFMLTSASDGTTTQTGLPSTVAISVLRTRSGGVADRVRRLQADPPGVRIIVVGHDVEHDASFGERERRGSGA